MKAFVTMDEPLASGAYGTVRTANMKGEEVAVKIGSELERDT